MRSVKHRLAPSIAGTYLLAVSLVLCPLVWHGYIGHGNGLVFLIATILTFPLSVVLFVLNDLLSDANAFYMTGWPYVITLGELSAAGLINAYLIYAGVRRWTR